MKNAIITIIIGAITVCAVIMAILNDKNCEQETYSYYENIKKEHIFNLSEHEKLCFGGTEMFVRGFLETPISCQEYCVELFQSGEFDDFYKVVKSFYANINNFEVISKRRIPENMLERWATALLSNEFFFGEKDEKTYILCDYVYEGEVYFGLRIYDNDKYSVYLEEKEMEQQKKIEEENKNAKIFPSL